MVDHLFLNLSIQSYLLPLLSVLVSGLTGSFLTHLQAVLKVPKVIFKPGNGNPCLPSGGTHERPTWYTLLLKLVTLGGAERLPGPLLAMGVMSRIGKEVCQTLWEKQLSLAVMEGNHEAQHLHVRLLLQTQFKSSTKVTVMSISKIRLTTIHPQLPTFLSTRLLIPEWQAVDPRMVSPTTIVKPSRSNRQKVETRSGTQVSRDTTGQWLKQHMQDYFSQGCWDPFQSYGGCQSKRKLWHRTTICSAKVYMIQQ